MNLAHRRAEILAGRKGFRVLHRCLAALLAGGSLHLAGLPAGAQSGQLPQPMGRRVGVWLTNSPSPLYYDTNRIDRAVQELAEAGFNTLYPNVWSRGTTCMRWLWAARVRRQMGSSPAFTWARAGSMGA